MMKPEPPQHVTRQQKENAGRRKQPVKRTAAAPGDIQERVILNKRIGNDERAELQHPFTVNRKRVLSELPGAVGKDVNKFQSVKGEKTK